MGGHGTSLLSYYFLEKNWKIFLNNIFHISRGGMLSAGEGGESTGGRLSSQKVPLSRKKSSAGGKESLGVKLHTL
jgi:hypothetical protein